MKAEFVAQGCYYGDEGRQAEFGVTFHFSPHTAMAPRKKTFPCGHRGFGQSCHRCADTAAARSRSEQESRERSAARASWEATFEADPIDLRCLPLRGLVLRARQILAAIAGGADYRSFGGKALANSGGRYISVPLGLRYRLLFCHREGGGLAPYGVFSHETYNNVLNRL